MTINSSTIWPSTYAELRDLGLAFEICEWLEFEIGINTEESVVVAVFLKVVQEICQASSIGIEGASNADTRLASSNKNDQIENEVAMKIRTALKSASIQKWPKSVVDYPGLAIA